MSKYYCKVQNHYYFLITHFKLWRKPNGLTYHGHGQGDEEDEHVSPEGIVVGSVALAEHVHQGVEPILGQGLKDSGGAYERRDGRGERRGEAAGVNQEAGERDLGQGLKRRER